MANGKFDKTITRSIIKILDSSARKHGLAAARHAATKWVKLQQDKARLLKEQAELQKGLAEVARRLSR